MNIKIHRGIGQIGGCITEISTATSRIFVDMGQNLPGNAEETTTEQDRAMVEGFFADNRKQNEAVFYTHAHEDHVGLFDFVPDSVDQYIGEGGKEILLAKYDLLKKGHELELGVGDIVSKHNGSEGQKASCENLHQILAQDKAKIRHLKSFKTWERTKPHARPKSIEVGNIRITPFFNCHSIYDSYMFLIEADGKRIWHMGDFREHGYMGKGLMPTLRAYAGNINVLITEGTMLGRNDECIHEREMSRKMTSVMDAFKYVVVLASATDIERLASIKNAAQVAHKEMYICSGYMNRTMKIFTKREAELSKGLFAFNPKFISLGNFGQVAKLKKKDFVLVTGVSHKNFVEDLCEELDPAEVVLIYSSWDGYYKDSIQVMKNPQYRAFREAFHNVLDIHTSGHADHGTIQKVIETIRPKQAIIGIHKDAGQSLETLDLSNEMIEKITSQSEISLD